MVERPSGNKIFTTFQNSIKKVILDANQKGPHSSNKENK
jgi:hypothetical protein